MDLKNINLLNDSLFKAIITHKDNRGLIIDVISAITKIEKKEFKEAIFISGEEIPKRKMSGKKQMVDISVRLKNEIRIIIELNQNNNKNIIEKNSIYALSVIIELTSKNIKKYPQVILINIDNFNKYKTDKPIIEFKIRDEEGNIESEIYQSIHLILENIKNDQYNIDKEIKKFMEFLREKDIEKLERSYEGDERYMAMVRTVEDLTTDPDLIGYYDYEEAKKQEVIDARLGGIEDGREEGLKAGIKQANIEIAENLLKMGVLTIEQIKDATGLSIEELEKIKKL